MSTTNNTDRKGFAVVTGASTGIGFELARQCIRDGHELLIAANESEIEDAARRLRGQGGRVDAVNADLSTVEGVERLLQAASGRPIDMLLANAGRGLGRAFLDQDFNDIRYVIDTNVTGTVYLIHKVAQQMRSAGRGRILPARSQASCRAPTRRSITAQRPSSIPSRSPSGPS